MKVRGSTSKRPLAFLTAVMVAFALIVPLIGTAFANHGGPNTATAAGTNLSISPTTDREAINVCNPYSVVLTNQGRNAEGETVDVRVSQSDAGTERNITIGFCDPDGAGPGTNLAGPTTQIGPRPSGNNPVCDVDDTDNQPNDGTYTEANLGGPGQPAGDPVGDCTEVEGFNFIGEFPALIHGEGRTDNLGTFTFGVISDSPGPMGIVVCFETMTINDDCANEQIFANASKDWVGAPSPQDVTALSCVPTSATNNQGERHTFRCTATGASGPVQGVTVNFDVTGGPNAEEVNSTTCGPTNAAGNTATGNPDPLRPWQQFGPVGAPGGDDCTYTDVIGPGSLPGVDTITAWINQTGGTGPRTAGPDAGEPQVTITKTFAGPARNIDCEPNSASNVSGTVHAVLCTVRSAEGVPVPGVRVTFTETGPGALFFAGGTVTTVTITTDANGQAQVSTTSGQNEVGTQSITGTIVGDLPARLDQPSTTACAGTSGNCSETVSKTWTGRETQQPPPPRTEQPHDRTLVITSDRHVDVGRRQPSLLIKGDLSSPGFPECHSDVPVKVQIRAGGEWVTRKSDTTSPNGVWKVLIQDVAANYRAVANRFVISDATANVDHICLRAADRISHRHGRRR